MVELATQLQFDEYGLLIDPADWSPELAQDLAERAGVGPLAERLLYRARQGWAPDGSSAGLFCRPFLPKR